MAPFGGFKASGIGRENGLEAITEYTETKTVWVELTGATRDPFQLGLSDGAAVPAHGAAPAAGPAAAGAVSPCRRCQGAPGSPPHSHARKTCAGRERSGLCAGPPARPALTRG